VIIIYGLKNVISLRTSVIRNKVISTNNTNNRTLKSVNIGNIKSIFENVGAKVANALLTAVITELSGLASGNKERILIRID